MIMNLISKEDLLRVVKQYIEDGGGVLEGAADTLHIIRLIENAEVKSTWVVKDRNR